MSFDLDDAEIRNLIANDEIDTLISAYKHACKERDEYAACLEDEKSEQERVVRCCQEADKIREDMSLDPVTRARRVLMARCDRYEYIPNYLAAVKDIDALIKAVQDDTCRAFNGVAGKDPF